MPIQSHRISKAQLADRLGVTTAAITKAVKSGRLTPPTKQDGEARQCFDKETVLREWATNTEPAVNSRKGSGQAAAREALAELESSADAPPPVASGLPDYNEARARRELANAEKAEIETELLKGSVIEVARASKALTNVGRVFRDGVQNMPERLAGELASMTDADAVHDRLTGEIDRVLNELSEKLAAGEWLSS